MSGEVECHHCHAPFNSVSRCFSLESGVTSDCQPWREEVRICVCAECGAVQAPIDEQWRRNVEKIYRAYDTYAAAGGEEQKVLDADGMSSRSRVLVEWLVSLGAVPANGEILDVGCGRGAFLAEFSRKFHDWNLSGTEFDDRNAEVLRKLPRFKSLQTARFADLQGEHDFISMIHVLEHIEDPVAYLTALRRRARNGALFLVQVPDWSENPFALAIADHATHFTPQVLEQVARKAGWEPVASPGHVVPKELTLLARAGEVAAADQIADQAAASRLEQRLNWLQGVRRQAKGLGESATRFGIFGTAVAGTWLAGCCKRVDFFVDEDPSRIGRMHLGVPILSPDNVPADADVFVGMAPSVADRVVAKHRHGAGRYHGVPPL